MVYVGVFTLYRLKVAIYMVFMGLFPVSLSLWSAQLIANDSGADMEQAGENTCYVFLKIFILVFVRQSNIQIVLTSIFAFCTRIN